MAATLASMVSAAKDLSDFQNDPSVGGSTWNNWINDGIERLYRIVVKLNVGAFQTTFSFTLTGATNLQAVTGMRRLVGVSRDPTVPGQRRSLPKYNFGERDSLGVTGPLSYCQIGQSISIEPSARAAGNYAAYYISGPTVLVNDQDTIDTVLDPYRDYAQTWAACKALGKEESDNRDMYGDLAYIEQSVIEAFAMIDGDDPSTIVDNDARGPVNWVIP